MKTLTFQMLFWLMCKVLVRENHHFLKVELTNFTMFHL